VLINSLLYTEIVTEKFRWGWCWAN